MFFFELKNQLIRRGVNYFPTIICLNQCFHTPSYRETQRTKKNIAHTPSRWRMFSETLLILKQTAKASILFTINDIAQRLAHVRLETIIMDKPQRATTLFATP